MKIFVTKYALTEGIEEYDFPSNDYKGSSGYFSHTVRSPWCRHFYSPREWFRTREEAVANAEQRRLKKIESVKKQLSKLEKIKF